jgi:DNA repair photolyase
MPGINDHPDQVRPIIERATKADASFLGGVALHLRDEVKDVFFAWLEEKRPDLLPKYEQLYRGRAYMQPAHRKQTTSAVRGWGRTRLRRSLADRSSSSREGAAPTGGRVAGVPRGAEDAKHPSTVGDATRTGPAGQEPLF